MEKTQEIKEVPVVPQPVETEEKVPLMFIDREQERFWVTADTYEGKATLRFQVKSPDGTTKEIEFFKDDAPFIEWMIREAAK